MNTRSPDSVFHIRNIRLFILFRLFFNARFYYPVFTILFLDFGLTLEQFALLNAVWAAAIVLLEVPSGALADIVGRRNLLVASGFIMVVEIALLCFTPLGNSRLIFTIFLINRILSGTAEASASGADEALAYDTLKRIGREKEWGSVLDMQMRFQSIGFVVTLSVGAAVYDPDLLNSVASFLGFNGKITQDLTLRLPLFLTLGMAAMALITALGMHETPVEKADSLQRRPGRRSISQAFRLTLQAGQWILHTPAALIVIAAGLVHDHAIRMTVTLNSQYFRMIHLPEATFGLIGSGMAMFGLIIPRVAHKLVRSRTFAFNIFLMAALTFAGLAGMALFLPYAGVVPVILLYCVMMTMSFFTSHYLNRITPSHQRATVLSFKGMSQNLAYGTIGIFYGLLVHHLRQKGFAGGVPEDLIFMESIRWFPWYFLLVGSGYVLYAAITIRKVGEQSLSQPGDD